MQSISSEDATQGLILCRALRANLGVPDPVCLLVLYKSTVRSIIENGGVCFSESCHMRRLERIQW
jgi:hypothetical protein